MSGNVHTSQEETHHQLVLRNFSMRPSTNNPSDGKAIPLAAPQHSQIPLPFSCGTPLSSSSQSGGETVLKQTTLPRTPDAKSPAGADIRFIMDGDNGNMIHSTVPPGQINRATVHATVSEFWFVLDGKGEIWRRDETGEQVTALSAGTSIDIPVRTAFQYRNVGNEPLNFICISMLPWPGDHEATHLNGKWEPSI